jgi:hypothetical protein
MVHTGLEMLPWISPDADGIPVARDDEPAFPPT